MTSSFAQFFRHATGDRDPYPYQERFAQADPLPHLLRAPTGAGKTAAAILGWLWRWKSKQPGTPRRLVYCLPMRVLVEQSEREANNWIDALFKCKLLEEKVPVHVLMGGVEAEKWYLSPEKPAVLIGTQDMLLSRALNRGYAASRFHWPIDFGLLNNDCLWVFDEPQLMGSGVSTSAQLAGLRKSLGTFGPCPSVWMSATLEPKWLNTIDFQDKFPGDPLELNEKELTTGELGGRMNATKILTPAGISVGEKNYPTVLAKAVAKYHRLGRLTLVVVNVVNRAKDVFAELPAAFKKAKKDLVNPLLIHSRFRQIERAERNTQLQQPLPPAGRVVVATQVVEAGVDISAAVLFTELAPWSSLVQRFGRCHRYGELTGVGEAGEVLWVDVTGDDKAARPYTAAEMETARSYLNGDTTADLPRPALNGRNVSPLALETFRREHDIRLPFEHSHVLRRRDLVDLFDTSADLSGNDIDVSRFVRGDKEDTDVQVFWRANPPQNAWNSGERRRQAARRLEICNVPISSFKTDFLGAGKTAYRFDYLEGKWGLVGKKDVGSVVPGQVFWILANQGGYDAEIGWFPTSGRVPDALLVPLPAAPPQQRGQRPEGFYDSDEWSQAQWKTIAEHTEDVVRKLVAIMDSDPPLPIPEGLRRVLEVAARWHDWGKAHDVFQSGVADVIENPRDKNLPENQRQQLPRPGKWRGCSVIAKAPDEFWQRYKRVVQPANSDKDLPERRVQVRRFRHELASTLGIMALERAGARPPDWEPFSPDERLLALYLIASHHGKIRLSIRTMPNEWPVPPDSEHRKFAAGVWDGDNLQSVDLGGLSPPAVVLLLDWMQLGGNQSWSSGILRLRDNPQFGPFRLAYLEALLRAADCRASDEGEGKTDE
jgi:CRISPR-associated endonuclease/helicase Cas3